MHRAERRKVMPCDKNDEKRFDNKKTTLRGYNSENKTNPRLPQHCFSGVINKTIVGPGNIFILYFF